jgi:DNA topoisomerase VI subunit B
MSTAALARTTFQTSRLLEFCSRKELVAQTGQPVEAWPLVVIKELIDNALDAVEEAGISPEISITVADGSIVVTDNSPGIPMETVKGLLDFTVRVSSREAYVSPTRGAQGNALKTVLAMPYVLDGTAGKVEIEALGIKHEIVFKVDAVRQMPVITHVCADSSVKTGTKVTVHWPNSASTILEGAVDRFLQIADDFAWINPHLKLSIEWECKAARDMRPPSDPAWPKWTPSQPTCPHWYDEQRLRRLIAAYVSHGDRSRTVREFVSEFRGLSGSAKQAAVVQKIDLTRASLKSLCADGEFDDLKIAALLDAMKQATQPVKPKMLGLIGRHHIEWRMMVAGVDMETFDYSQVLGVTDDGLPYVVEFAFGWSPDADGRRLITGINWSPGITNPFRQIRDFYTSLDSILAELYAGAGEPVFIVLHVACPRVEYTDRGKSAIALSDTSLSAAIVRAVRKGVAKWAKQRKAEERHASALQNRRERLIRSRRVTIKDAAWDVMERAYMKASANDTLPANATQIMYAARNHIQAATVSSLIGNISTKQFSRSTSRSMVSNGMSFMTIAAISLSRTPSARSGLGH